MNEAKKIEPLKLTDTEVLMLLQATELNAGSKAASIHQKQLYAALHELYEYRKFTQEKKNEP